MLGITDVETGHAARQIDADSVLTHSLTDSALAYDSGNEPLRGRDGAGSLDTRPDCIISY